MASDTKRAFDRAFKAGKRAVRSRSGGRCEICARRAVLTHHKLMSRTHPRCNEPEHLMHLCLLCHVEVHAHPAESYELGRLLHDWDVPRSVGEVGPLLVGDSSLSHVSDADRASLDGETACGSPTDLQGDAA